MSTELLALLGGTPSRPEGPPTWPLPDPDVQAAIAEVMASGGWGKYHGDHGCALEPELAAFHGVPHAVTCASGTLAVEVALRALRVGPGDEVVMAAYDYEPTFLTIHALGAKTVLVDVRGDDWQLDPGKLEAAFTPQTKAVICSHLHGGIVRMSEVVAVAHKRGVGVVEDAAQGLGATVEGKPAGTSGDVGVVSFGGTKVITAGRGGAVLTRDTQLHQRAKTWLHRGYQQWAPLSELQAAALRPQLAKLKEMTVRRSEAVRALLGLLRPIPGLRPLAQLLSGVPGGDTANEPAFYKVGFQYDPGAFGLTRERFVKALQAEGVAFDVGFKALHVGRSPSRFRGAGELVQATAAGERCVNLFHPVLSGALRDIQQVADAVAKVYRYRDRL